ncbi:MAG: hypothetical protein JSV10_06410 [Candidatus Zixiibacteriota bacterium]|nr:MAG: hypothetical protein JSV10_06410 [candidate division Zixibacteria bacterium]
MTKDIINRLLNSSEPSVRFKVLVNVLGRKVDSPGIRRLQERIKSSPRAKLLLSERGRDGKIACYPYKKWCGAHWTLATLADIGYPPGDESLVPLREQVYAWLFSERHQKSIRVIGGRIRRCASQEGNAVFYLLKLGLADDRTEELAERLIEWQWPDGGWNCDKNPEAAKSSFWESLIPLRALALHARLTGNQRSKKAAEGAAEVFLKRRLCKRLRDGKIMQKDFLRLHYPCYWRYDILFGLKVMAEAGFINDERCRDALDILESKRLPDGGFPAECKYYRVSDEAATGRSLVDWGGVSKKRMNEFVTVDALYALNQAGRSV